MKIFRFLMFLTFFVVALQNMAFNAPKRSGNQDDPRPNKWARAMPPKRARNGEDEYETNKRRREADFTNREDFREREDLPGDINARIYSNGHGPHVNYDTPISRTHQWEPQEPSVLAGINGRSGTAEIPESTTTYETDGYYNPASEQESEQQNEDFVMPYQLPSQSPSLLTEIIVWLIAGFFIHQFETDFLPK